MTDTSIRKVHHVHVIPNEIDFERFKAALSKTVARYPHTAGRLIREGDDWKINLTNSPIPVLISRVIPNPSELSKSFPFPNDFTLQPAHLIQPFWNSEDCGKSFIFGDGKDPLLGFKLTVWENGTAIGISWYHVCGDGFSIWDFTRCLSTYYVDLDAPESALPLAPSFYRHFFRNPFSREPGSPDLTENFLPRMPHYARDYDMAQLEQKYAARDAIAVQVQLRISGESLEKIFNGAKEADQPASEGVKITLHDALVAYLVKVLNQCQEKPTQMVTLVLNYRGSSTKPSTVTTFNAPSAQGNAIIVVSSDPLPSSASSVSALSRFIRTTVNQTRDHKFVEKWVCWASYLLGKSANAGQEGRFPFYGPEDGEVWINSTYRTDWNDAHFGFPGKARFFTWVTTMNYFRIICANPRADGSTSSNGVNDANVCVKIHKDYAERFASIITQEYPDTLVEQ
ncbi:hypothetical protein FRC00_004676 [Tulasnella sp. 408]|nr:hypothetical protein FRC00_004676 [Tulasnella sp. 408]